MRRIVLGTLLAVLLVAPVARAQDSLSDPPAFAPMSVKGGQVIRMNVVCFEHESGGLPVAPCTGEFMFHDVNGRDLLARMIWGSRISLSVGFVAVAIYVFIGIILGAGLGAGPIFLMFGSTDSTVLLA
mgnify:CR=1 FL=1